MALLAGTEIQVNATAIDDQYAPDITALAGGGWVITWHSILADGSGTAVYQQLYNADGTP